MMLDQLEFAARQFQNSVLNRFSPTSKIRSTTLEQLADRRLKFVGKIPLHAIRDLRIKAHPCLPMNPARAKTATHTVPLDPRTHSAPHLWTA